MSLRNGEPGTTRLMRPKVTLRGGACMTLPADNDLSDWRPVKPHLLRGNSEIFNRILLMLPADVREEVRSACHFVEFPSDHVIYRSGAEIENTYFVNSGLVSLLKNMADGRSVEIGTIGREGLIGVFAASGFGHALADYIVQVPLAALRIKCGMLQRLMSKHDALRFAIKRYLFMLSEQLAQVSACNRLHSLEQRCCHWMLVARDNAPSDEFQLTHEFLASLLGVQRPSVSMTANGLQRRGLIRYCHGRITILDRAALEEGACECYRTVRRLIDKCFDPTNSHPEPVKHCYPERDEQCALHENFALKLSGT